MLGVHIGNYIRVGTTGKTQENRIFLKNYGMRLPFVLLAILVSFSCGKSQKDRDREKSKEMILDGLQTIYLDHYDSILANLNDLSFLTPSDSFKKAGLENLRRFVQQQYDSIKAAK